MRVDTHFVSMNVAPVRELRRTGVENPDMRSPRKHWRAYCSNRLSESIRGTPTITPAVQRTRDEGVMREAAGRSIDQRPEEENETIVESLRLRAQQELRGAAGVNIRMECP